MGNLNEKLYEFSEKGDLSGVKKVIEKDKKGEIDYNYQKPLDKEKTQFKTPLFIACEKNHTKIVEELLKHDGIDINVDTHDGRSPILFALQNNIIDLVKLLMNHETFNPNQPVTEDGLTPLTMMCDQEDRFQIIETLLKHPRIDVNREDKKNSWTPLYYCVNHKILDHIRLLLNSPVIDVNKGDTRIGTTPFMKIVEMGNLELFEEFSSLDDIDLNKEDVSGHYNPLFLSMKTYVETKSENHFKIFEELLQNPSVLLNYPRSCKEGPKIPLNYAFLEFNDKQFREKDQEEAKKVFSMLISDDRINVNMEDDNLGSRTPLMLACAYGCLNAARIFLSHKKIKVNHSCSGENQYGRGETPLIFASMKGCVEGVKLLLEDERTDIAACTYREEDPGLQAIQCAALAKNTEIVKLLVEYGKGKGVDCNIGTSYREKDKFDTVCPLYVACAQNDVPLIEYLLSLPEIDVNRKEEQPHMTPLYIAAEKGNLEAVQLLCSFEKTNINKGRSEPKGYREEVSGAFLQTPLGVATEKGNIEVVKYLLTLDKIDLNAGYPRSPYGTTKNKAIQKLLKEHPKFKGNIWEDDGKSGNAGGAASKDDEFDLDLDFDIDDL